MPQILESAPPTQHDAYYTGFCAICHATHVAHAVDGKLWCCKCWVENGFPPADWHPGCMEQLAQHKKVVAASTDFPNAKHLISRSAAIVQRAAIVQERICVDCEQPSTWVIWDAKTDRALCADCKANRVDFDMSRKSEGKPLFPI